MVTQLRGDELMFIQPSQNGSLTPREASRIQGCPEWSEFLIVLRPQLRVSGNTVLLEASEIVGNPALK